MLLAGCGGPGATSEQVRSVRALVPGAHEIACEREGAVTRCEAKAGNALSGHAWTCEFETQRARDGVAYSGTQSCWTSRN